MGLIFDRASISTFFFSTNALTLTPVDTAAILKNMPRLLVHLVLALGLIGATGSGAAAAAAVDCTMTAMESMSEMSGDQDHIDCCTPECALASPGMAIPALKAAVECQMPTRATVIPSREVTPLSVMSEALDPPPRIRLT